MKKGLFILAMLLMGLGSSWAQEFSAVNGDGKTIYYSVTDATNHEVAVVASPTESPYYGVIKIPEMVEHSGDTYTITSVADHAFANCQGLISVSLSDGVRVIREEAFMNCLKLTSLFLGDGMDTIANRAFAESRNMASMTIGSSIDYIGDEAFHNTAISILRMYAVVPPTLGNGVFNTTGPDITIVVPCEAMSAYQSAEGWSYFTNYQCEDASALTFGMVNDAGVKVWYRVIDAENHKVEVMESPIDSLYSGAVDIPESVVYDGTTYVVSRIGIGSFMGCTNLTSVSMGSSITEIGNSAFISCSELVSATLNNGLKTIGREAFCNCVHLESMVVPNTVTKIGVYCFQACKDLSSITLSNKLRVITSGMLWSCSSLTSVVIPNSVSLIGDVAFEHCSAMTSVVIPPSVKRLCWRAFGESGLTSVVLPEGMKVIANQVFIDCPNLTSVSISSTVDTIKNEAFKGCSAIESIYMKATTVPGMEWSTFNGIDKEASVYVPCDALSSYTANGEWGYFTNIQCKEMFHVEATSNDEARGTVIGSGDYFEGESALLTAMAKEGYHFVSWNDGNTENPRMVAVTAETSYTATFEVGAPQGIDDVDGLKEVRVYPNPTRGMIEVAVEGVERIEVLNVVGEKVAEVMGESRVDLSNLSNGMYVLRIVTDKGMLLRKVIKQ